MSRPRCTLFFKVLSPRNTRSLLRIYLLSFSLAEAATVNILQVSTGASTANFNGQNLAPNDVLSYQIDPSPSGYSDSELVFRTLGGFLLKIGPLPATSGNAAPSTGKFTIPGVQSGHYLLSISDSQSGAMSGDTPELSVIVGSAGGGAGGTAGGGSGAGGSGGSGNNPSPVSSPAPQTITDTISISQKATNNPGSSIVLPVSTTTDPAQPVVQTDVTGPTITSPTTTPPTSTTPIVSNGQTHINGSPDQSQAPLSDTQSKSLTNSSQVVPNPQQSSPSGGNTITQPTSDPKKPPVKLLAAIIAGALLFMLLLILLVFFMRRRRRRGLTVTPMITANHIPQSPSTTISTAAHPYHGVPSAITSQLNVHPAKLDNKFAPEFMEGSQRPELTEVIAHLQDRIRRMEETSNLISVQSDTDASTSYISSGQSDDPPPLYPG